MLKIKKYIKEWRNIVFMLIGPLILAFGLCAFMIPNQLVVGGVSAVSTILYYTVGISPSIASAVINGVLLILACRILGLRFTITTGICTGLLSAYMAIFERVFTHALTDNILLSTVCGAILYGVGAGITLVSGASTGGTDIVGRLIQHAAPNMPIGKLMLIVDGIIITVSFIVFRNLDLTLFSAMALTIATFSVDYLITILNISKLAFVISNKGDQIAKKLIEASTRGITVIDVKGAYTKEDKKMLVCALKSKEVPAFQRRIDEVDPEAFVIFSESQQIVGKGFRLYK